VPMQTSRTYVMALAAGLAVVLAAGSERGSASGSVFTPPPGWRAVADFGNGLGVWAHGDARFNQNVNVIAERYAGSLAQYSKEAVTQIQSKLSDAKIGVLQHARVCGSHPATYVSYTATVAAKPLIYEAMMTIWQGTAYVATYTRMRGQPSLGDARTSLTTLCGAQPPFAARPRRYPTPPPGATPVPTEYMGPAASPQTYGNPAPTVTPRLGP
jgi:hypothetical protein